MKFMLYSLHNRLALLHKYTSTRASDGSAPIIVLVHLSSGWVTLRPVMLNTARFLSGVLHHRIYLWP